MENKYCDFLIIGAGIIGLSIAKALLERFPESSIYIVEKEQTLAQHSSGRNSGVLHAGFYYTENSFKAKFTKEGNQFWRNYCLEYNLKIKDTKKIIVCKREEDLPILDILKRRGDFNSISLYIIDEKILKEIEPNAKTYKKALFSPLTATINPVEIVHHLYKELLRKGVQVFFNEPFLKQEKNFIITKNYKIYYKKLINCSGLYADKIAKSFGMAKNYIILPFKGLYLEYTGNDLPIRTNIYPVPDLRNPFLGVHFTITVDNKIKLGPTAIPAFWRENYKGFSNFRFKEFQSIFLYEILLFFKNKNFRNLAIKELKKLNQNHLIREAKDLVHNLDFTLFAKNKISGIRAQLLDIKTMQLVEDFIIESNEKSIHILNAVSPAFTAAAPFAKYIVKTFLDESLY